MKTIETVENKIEDFLLDYVKNLKEKPVMTIIKTLIVIWVGAKILKLIRK